MTYITIPINASYIKSEGMEEDFRPWEINISPSSLYNCSLPLRKKLGMKTLETRWKSMRRWHSNTSNGIDLPDGVFVSEKRQELFVSRPVPEFKKINYVLVLLPYGNVHFSYNVEKESYPITETWLFEAASNNKTNLENLIQQDYENPIKGYFVSCKRYLDENPDQIGIHLKRMKKSPKK